MPLVVRAEDENTTTYVLSRKVKSGREANTIHVGKDPSISRNHAEIKVQRTSGALSKDERPHVSFTDKGSKCGSFQGGLRLPANVEHNFDGFSTITVGANSTTITLEWEPILAVCSSLPNKEHLTRIRNTASRVGIRVERNWLNNATHLIMLDLRATPKLILALVGNKHIVTPQFFDAITTRNTPASAMPQPEE